MTVFNQYEPSTGDCHSNHKVKSKYARLHGVIIILAVGLAPTCCSDVGRPRSRFKTSKHDGNKL